MIAIIVDTLSVSTIIIIVLTFRFVQFALQEIVQQIEPMEFEHKKRIVGQKERNVYTGRVGALLVTRIRINVRPPFTLKNSISKFPFEMCLSYDINTPVGP